MYIMNVSENHNKNSSKESKLDKNYKQYDEKNDNFLSKDTNELSKDKSLKFPLEFKSKYEIINRVSENGDSIYSYSINDEIQEGKEQIFILLSEIRKIVNEELDRD